MLTAKTTKIASTNSLLIYPETSLKNKALNKQQSQENKIFIHLVYPLYVLDGLFAYFILNRFTKTLLLWNLFLYIYPWKNVPRTREISPCLVLNSLDFQAISSLQQTRFKRSFSQRKVFSLGSGTFTLSLILRRFQEKTALMRIPRNNERISSKLRGGNI